MKLTDVQQLERHRARIRTLTDRVIRLEEQVEQLSAYGLFEKEPPFKATSKEEWRDMINSYDTYHVPTREEIEDD